jgi:hypothetical protein
MAKRITKAALILAEAKGRVIQAGEKVMLAQQEVIAATQVLAAYETTYRSLETALAPKPRGRSTPAPTVEKKSSRKRAQPELVLSTEAGTGNVTNASKPIGEMCGVCGNAELFTDHFKPSPNFHKFEGKKAASAA